MSEDPNCDRCVQAEQAVDVLRQQLNEIETQLRGLDVAHDIEQSRRIQAETDVVLLRAGLNACKDGVLSPESRAHMVDACLSKTEHSGLTTAIRNALGVLKALILLRKTNPVEVEWHREFARAARAVEELDRFNVENS